MCIYALFIGQVNFEMLKKIREKNMRSHMQLMGVQSTLKIILYLDYLIFIQCIMFYICDRDIGISSLFSKINGCIFVHPCTHIALSMYTFTFNVLTRSFVKNIYFRWPLQIIQKTCCEIASFGSKFISLHRPLKSFFLETTSSTCRT
jgi:hypothetical protein